MPSATGHHYIFYAYIHIFLHFEAAEMPALIGIISSNDIIYLRLNKNVSFWRPEKRRITNKASEA